MKNYLQFETGKLTSAVRMGALLAVVLIFSGQVRAQYCASSFSSVAFEYLSNVTFGTINNTTTGVAGYNNFTALSTDVTPGGTYPLSVSIFPDANDYIYAFIDWNQNGTLNDAGEVYTVAIATSSAGPHTISVVVPAAAIAGPTRMRVQCDWANAIPNPCKVATFGEVEDYTVNVSSVPNDAGVASIDSPAGGCAGTYNVVATIKNFGINQVNPVTVNWSHNSTIMNPITYTSVLDTLGGSGSQTAQVSLGTVTLVAGSMDTIAVWTEMPNNVNDSNPANDKKSKYYTVLTVIDSFPYYQDYESGQGDWQIVGTNSSWAFGTPAKTNISGASSGVNAFVTSLTGNYNASENSQVTSPCFDFTNFEGTPWVALNANWYSEGGYDGAVLQSSINDGLTWQNVGAFGDPNNWYNDNSLDNRPGGSITGWAGTGTASSNGWKRAKHVLPSSLVGKQVRLRIAFGADPSVQYAGGFAFDNLTIVDFKEANLGQDTLSLCGKPNITLDPHVNFNGTIEWSTTDTVSETITVTAAGNYWVIYTDSLINESTRDSIEIIQSVAPVIAFEALVDTILDTETITLDPHLPFDLDYTWTPDNVNFPYLLAKGSDLGVGVHQKTLKVVDDVLCEDMETVTIVVINIDGVDENANGRIELFPNPVRDELNVVLVNQNYDRVEVRLFDMSGKLIYSSAQSVNGNTNIKIDMSGLISGPYMLQIGNGENTVMRKLIKE